MDQASDATHTGQQPTKRLAEYLREGLMIFVAVMLGFLADSSREYLGDREQETAYLMSLREDLQSDTARLHYSISRISRDIANGDSAIRAYAEHRATGRYPSRLSVWGQSAAASVDVVFNDRTSSQLKGSGSMRLIRDQALATMMLAYWNNQIALAQIHDRFETQRMEQRTIGFRVFDWYPTYMARSFDVIDTTRREWQPALVDPSGLREFINITSSLRNVAISQYLPALRDEVKLAEQLIARLPVRSGGRATKN